MQEIELTKCNLLYEGHVGFHTYRIHETTKNVVIYTVYNNIGFFFVFQKFDLFPLHLAS